jgi:hypothetical protein
MSTNFAAWALTDRPDALTLRSTDGVLVVTLRRTAGGLFVERVLQRPKAARVVQATVFDTPRSFHRWCQADPSRFEYPLLHAKLTRGASELFPDHADAQDAG